ERARALGRSAAVLTFEPHPRAVFRPEEPVFRLTDEAAKLRLLARTGLDGAIVMRFDPALAALSAEDFVRRILVERFAVAGVVIGFDFHFGRGRAGSPALLAAPGASHGFPVAIVPPCGGRALPPGRGPPRSRGGPRAGGRGVARLPGVGHRRGGAGGQARARVGFPDRQSAARSRLCAQTWHLRGSGRDRGQALRRGREL